jgi:hypothetical protein
VVSHGENGIHGVRLRKPNLVNRKVWSLLVPILSRI